MSEYKSTTWVDADDPCGQTFCVKGLARGSLQRFPWQQRHVQGGPCMRSAIMP